MTHPEQNPDGQTNLWQGDCRDIAPQIGSVDLVLFDPPYGTTRCSWDAIIPFEEMWDAVRAVSGKNIPVVIFGCEPFSSALRLSNIKQFKYDWIWHKPKATGFLNAKKQPMRAHETISVFCNGRLPYYPKMTQGHSRKVSFRGAHLQTDVYGRMANDYRYDSTERYPRTVLTFSSDTQNSSLHPTQKPVDLVQYLIETYTTPGALVCDLTMGSGTTGIACARSGRRFVGIEADPEIFAIARDRINGANGPIFEVAA